MIDGPKPYSAMKDSGLEWLGNVPAHWSVLPLKRIAQFNGGSGFPVSAQGDTHEEILFAKVSDMNRPGNEREITRSANTVSLEVARSLGAQVFERDTIIFPKVGGALLTNKRRLLVRETCIDNNLMGCVVRGASAAFTFRMLRWLDLARMAKPGPIPAISEGDVREIRVTIPPLPEQTAIVRFLNHADQRIHRYIRAKQKLIALLEEQKQAIIHHAVTGQIDVRTGQPYRAYKPSGVEWIGEVPEHWEVKRFKSLVRHIDQGVSPQAENYLADGTAWGVLKAGCVNRGVFRESEHKRLAFDYAFDPLLAVAVGDVLVSRASGSPHLVSSVGLVSSLKYNLILSDKTFRPIFNREINPEFMVLAMNGRYYRDQVERAISGAEGLANNLPLSSLRAFFFVVPSSDEQHKIIGYMRRSINELSGAVAYAERETLLLREYHTRLIADVVTGKVDVREAAAALPAVDPLAADDDLDDTIDADDRPEFDNDEEVSELEY